MQPQLVKKYFIGGNWKMNGSQQLIKEFSNAIIPSAYQHLQVVIFAPFPYLPLCSAQWQPTGLTVGAQSINGQPEKGAQTSQVSPAMLKDLGISWVLIGHSECRNLLHESENVFSSFLFFYPFPL